MERDMINSRITGKALGSLFPSLMENSQTDAVDELNSFATRYLPMMTERYGLQDIEPPKITTYDTMLEDSYGYIGKPIRQVDLDRKIKVLSEVKIDKSSLFAAQMTGQPYQLLERIGGFLGTAIRWNTNFPSVYVPFEEEVENFRPAVSEEEKKNYRMAQESREISYFFDWIGSHVLRDVVDGTWKLEHEIFDTDVAPFFSKQKKEVLQRMTAGKREIAMAAMNTSNTKEGLEAYHNAVYEAASKMLGEFGMEALQSDNPYEREAYRELFVFSYPGLHDSNPTEIEHSANILVSNKWEIESKRTPIEEYAESYPRFFNDLIECVKVTPEIVYERLVRKAKSDDSRCVKDALMAIKKSRTFTYFDLMNSPDCTQALVFKTAENNESFLLGNLPTVVRMSDQEIKSRFLKKQGSTTS